MFSCVLPMPRVSALLPRIRVLATGGTIAGAQVHSTMLRPSGGPTKFKTKRRLVLPLRSCHVRHIFSVACHHGLAIRAAIMHVIGVGTSEPSRDGFAGPVHFRSPTDPMRSPASAPAPAPASAPAPACPTFISRRPVPSLVPLPVGTAVAGDLGQEIATLDVPFLPASAHVSGAGASRRPVAPGG